MSFSDFYFQLLSCEIFCYNYFTNALCLHLCNEVTYVRYIYFCLPYSSSKKKLICILVIVVVYKLMFIIHKNSSSCAIPTIWTQQPLMFTKTAYRSRDIVIILNDYGMDSSAHVSAYFNRCNNVNYARRWCMYYWQWLACCLSALVIPASFTPVNRKIGITPTLQRYLLATKAVRFVTFAFGERNQVYLSLVTMQKQRKANQFNSSNRCFSSTSSKRFECKGVLKKK